MEQGNWTQEEYTVNATFPFVAGKVIERGQRLSFRDPATGSIEVFEIRNVTNIEPEHYQQIIAEHIAVSELSDEHINTQEITNKTPAQALATVLAGTLWTVGNVAVTRTSSADIARGSAWQAVCVIAQNWNVYIVPRVTVNAAGAITGKFLDVIESNGTWRGLRLSIDKNMSDSSVVYDDSETLTALYGYGGTIEQTQSGTDDTRVEVTFASVVWSATSSHPAKPSGQTYLEDPAKTALYGRNGRPRFGFYQNGDITDPAVLLEKTWEALKLTSSPKISISGTVSDLYRLGYKDEPIRLHDMAIVEIPETGEKFYLQIIKNDVDLIDPTATRTEIGAYIPNIIYINRESMEMATGGGDGGGGGGGRGQNNKEYKEAETYSAIEKTDNMIALVVGTRNGNNYIKAGEIGLAINKSGESGSYESTAYINANHINISATNTAHTLAGDLEHDAQGRLIIKNAGGMYVQRTESGITTKYGVFDNGNLTGGVVVEKINGQKGTITRVRGSVIVIGDDQTIDPTYRGKTLDGTLTQITSDFTTVNTLLAKKIEADDINATTVTAALSKATLVNVKQLSASSSIGCTGPISGASLSIGGHGMNIYDGQVSSDGTTLTLFRLSGGSLSFNKAATLQATYGGDNKGTEATYTVTGSPAANFPSGATKTGTFTLHINAKAAWVTDPNGTIRARVDNPSDTDEAYNNGWNDCRDAALDSGSKLSYYTGDVTTKYDAPSVGAQGRQVIYPYSSHSRTVYTIPDAKE
jgi:phage minor structural protein